MGIVHGVSEFVPHFKSHGERCHIVNTASIAGFYPLPYVALYSATKFAVVGLSENLASNSRVPIVA